VADDRTRRRLDVAYGLVALVGMVVVVWERLSPEGPQTAYERVRAGVCEWRGYREAMRRTMAEIQQLPEQPPAEPSESPLPSEGAGSGNDP
jgi:hypothetical protein